MRGLHPGALQELFVGFDQIFDSNDSHPNKFFNRVLFDSIIIKLKEKGII
jgi:hypothetical protein